MAGGDLSLFLHHVRDLITRAPVTARPGDSAVEIARLLSRQAVGSVVIVGDDGSPLGIVTDRDLRRRVVADGRDAATTLAGEIMSSPLVTIRPDAFAFEALLEMTRREIRHLVVVDGDRMVGVVSSHDVLVLQATHPVMLAREITRAASLDGLAALGPRVTALAERLVAEGGTAYDIAQIIAELHDRMAIRVLALITSAWGASGEVAPVPYCWLVFGSEARREQTLRTDQDNGLVYADPPPDGAAGAAAFFNRFAQEAVEGLVRVGFPRCPAGVMASNPQWCQPASAWSQYFRRLVLEPRPEQVLGASIHFDLRPLSGATDLGTALIDQVHAAVGTQRGLLGLLARDVVERPVGLTLFGAIGVRRSGPHRGSVDLKGAGTMQMVGAARIHALELALKETNTIDRFRAAADRGLYTDEELRDIADACQQLMRLRLVHQLEQVARREPTDNRVRPDRLSHADRLLLREALRTVSHVQSKLRERFATDFVPG